MGGVLLAVEALVAGWAVPACGPCTFTLSVGEVLGLRGANGAGKSTLLAALTDEARVFSGRIVRARHCRTALLPQHLPPVAGWPVSGHDLLRLSGAQAAGLPAWLTGCLGQRLDALSGGQRQFLRLWALLARPAEIVLLDEPTNHLDVPGCAHLAATLRQRAQAGGGVIVASHDAAFLGAVCDREVLL